MIDGFTYTEVLCSIYSIIGLFVFSIIGIGIIAAIENAGNKIVAAVRNLR
jgi:hypothetical protein